MTDGVPWVGVLREGRILTAIHMQTHSVCLQASWSVAKACTYSLPGTHIFLAWGEGGARYTQSSARAICFTDTPPLLPHSPFLLTAPYEPMVSPSADLWAYRLAGRWPRPAPRPT